VNHWRVTPLLLAVLAAVVAGSGASADIQTARAAKFASLPDWSGLWEMGRPGATPAGVTPADATRPRSFGPPPPAIPYNAVWQQKLADYRRQLDQIAGDEQEPDTTVTRCVWGIPRIYQGPYQFDIKVTPELVVFTYDVGEYRRIWTDGRAHPTGSSLQLTNMGHSIGHWDGEILVVDTVGLKPDIWVASNGATLSEQTHVTEHWQMNGADRMTVAAVIADPARLTGTYTVSNSYGRVTDTNRIVQQSCFENVREVLIGDHVITQFGAGH
jgi:hypothetical protein